MDNLQLTEDQKHELDKRLALFFFNPSKSRDKYIREFREVYGTNRYAYSPLFLLRRDIFLFLRFDHFCSALKVDHRADFPALLLADIIIEGLVFNITSENAGVKANGADFSNFYQQYFSFNKVEGLITRQLRNALQHNFNQLITRVENKDNQKTNFNLVKSYLEKERLCKIDGVDYFKLGYQLSTSFPVVAEFGEHQIKPNYCVVETRVNPMLFLDRLEMAIHQLRKDLTSDSKIARNFLENLTIDNWMKVF